MQYRKLGNTGIQISALSLGSWITFGKQIEDNISEKLMSVAYDAGINFFDNAEIYARGQSEIVMGKALKNSAANLNSLRLYPSQFHFAHVHKFLRCRKN